MKGRPTKYNQELVEKAKYYCAHWEEETDDVIPSIEGLSEYINIARSTIYKWADEEGKEDFSDTLSKIEQKQKIALLNKGLKGEFNAAITKLALSHNHGMAEKTETKSQVEIDLKNLSDEQLEDLVNGDRPTG